MIVLDASAIVELLLDSIRARRVASLFASQQSHAPELVGFEVLSAIQGHTRGRKLTPEEGLAAMLDFESVEANLELWPLLEIMSRRAVELRDNVSAYDASYVALAGILQCPLVTADARLGRAVADRIEVTVV